MAPLQVTFSKISSPFLKPCALFNPRNQWQVCKLTIVEDKKRMALTGQKSSSIIKTYKPLLKTIIAENFVWVKIKWNSPDEFPFTSSVALGMKQETRMDTNIITNTKNVHDLTACFPYVLNKTYRPTFNTKQGTGVIQWRNTMFNESGFTSSKRYILCIM